jgi:hypothetical protein
MRVEHQFSKILSQLVVAGSEHEFEISPYFDSSGEIYQITLEMTFALPTLGSGSSFPYVHTQSSPSDLWTVNHNLGYRPVIEVLSDGGLVVEASVAHISVNQAQISFNTVQTGTVTAR